MAWILFSTELGRAPIPGDGRLLGRYSGRDIEAYLPGHGRLDAEGAAFFGAVLRRFAQKEVQP